MLPRIGIIGTPVNMLTMKGRQLCFQTIRSTVFASSFAQSLGAFIVPRVLKGLWITSGAWRDEMQLSDFTEEQIGFVWRLVTNHLLAEGLAEAKTNDQAQKEHNLINQVCKLVFSHCHEHSLTFLKEELLKIYAGEQLHLFATDRQLNVWKMYVELEMEDQAGKKLDIVELKDVWELGSKRFQIDGCAGSGKSTLCKFIGQCWYGDEAKQRRLGWSTMSKHFEAVIVVQLVRLRSLESRRLSPESIVKLLFRSKKKDDIEAIATMLRSRKEHVLYVLDGYEEAEFGADGEFLEDLQALMDGRLGDWLEYCIVTTRPEKRSLDMKSGKKLSLRPFDADGVRSYVDKFFESKKENERKEKVDAAIKRPEVLRLCKIPLLLELVCVLSEDNDVASSLCGLYAQLSERLKLRAAERSATTICRDKISDKAFETITIVSLNLQKHGGMITEEMIFDACKKNQNIMEEIIHSGFFVKQNVGAVASHYSNFDPPEMERKVGEKESFVFIHTSVREYLAAKRIGMQFREKTRPNFQEIIEPVADVQPQHRMFLLFLLGILREAQKEMFVRALFELLMDGLVKEGKRIDVRSLEEQKRRIDQMGLSLVVEVISEIEDLATRNRLSRNLVDKTRNIFRREKIGGLWRLLCEPAGFFGNSYIVNEIANGEEEKQSALKGAVEGDRQALVQLLLKKKADPMLVLDRAAFEGLTETVEKLLIHKPDGVSVALEAALRNSKWNLVERLASKVDLSDATRYGHVNVIKYLVDKGADVNTAISGAASTGNMKLIDELMKLKGADASKVDLSGAARNGHLDVIKYLMNKGADVNQVGSDKKPLVAFYAERGNLEMVKFLVNNGVDVNPAITSAASKGNMNLIDELMKFKGADASKVNLSGAAQNGHLDMIKYLVGKGADVNQQVGSDKKPLVAFYAEKGNLEMVKYLVDKGADASKVDLSGAAKNGHLDVIKYLVDQGADVNAAISGTASNGNMKLIDELMKLEGADASKVNLYPAAYAGHWDIVMFLHEKGGDVANVDLRGAFREGGWELIKVLAKKGAVNSAIAFAAASNNRRWLEELLALEGANISRVDLQRAVDNGYFEVMQFLIEQGAKASTLAVCQASRNGHWDLVQYLVENAADASSLDLYAPAFTGNVDRVKFFVKNGANINTAIFGAVGGNDTKVVAALLQETGANINSRNSYGWTPLLWAAALPRVEMVQFLVQRGSVLTEDHMKKWVRTTGGDLPTIVVTLEKAGAVDALRILQSALKLE